MKCGRWWLNMDVSHGLRGLPASCGVCVCVGGGGGGCGGGIIIGGCGFNCEILRSNVRFRITVLILSYWKASLNMSGGCERESESPLKKGYRRKRTAFTDTQLVRMERVFQENKYPGISVRETLAANLGVSESRVQVSRRSCLNSLVACV